MSPTQQQQHAPAAQPTSAASPALLDKVLEATIAKLDAEASRYFEAIQNQAMGTMYKAVVVAKGINALRKSIEPLMPFFMDLQGSDLGFKTDKEKEGGYPHEVVRECLVTAFLIGVLPTGNQMNIIAGRCYVTKNGWEKKCLDIPGLTDLECIPGVPALREGHTCVRVRVKWKIGGVAQELFGADDQPGRVFPVRVNNGMIVDAILGKAKGKAFHAAYETIRGRDFLATEDGESLADGEIPVTQQRSSAAKSLEKLNGFAADDPKPDPPTPPGGMPASAPAPAPAAPKAQTPVSPPASAEIVKSIKDEVKRLGEDPGRLLKPYRRHSFVDLSQQEAQELLDGLRDPEPKAA